MTTYCTHGLPNGTALDQVFEFVIDDTEPLRLRIPGEHRGPDVCIADSPAQEQWLDSRRDLMVTYWDCQWTFVDDAAKEQFVRLMNATAR